MKKLLAFILLSLSFVLLFGCAKKQEPQPTPAIIIPTIPTPVPTPTESVIPKENEMFFNTPAVAPQEVYIVITKSKKTLELYGDGTLFARFPIRLGEQPVGTKEKEGDQKTPEGEYYICTRKDKDTENTLFMGLSYPNQVDAQRGLDNKVIDKEKHDSIVKAINRKERPTWSSALGGAIGIHGKYDDREFTQGCIAVSDTNVQIIWDYTKMGTKVTILP